MKHFLLCIIYDVTVFEYQHSFNSRIILFLGVLRSDKTLFLVFDM